MMDDKRNRHQERGQCIYCYGQRNEIGGLMMGAMNEETKLEPRVRPLMAALEVRGSYGIAVADMKGWAGCCWCRFRGGYGVLCMPFNFSQPTVGEEYSPPCRRSDDSGEVRFRRRLLASVRPTPSGSSCDKGNHYREKRRQASMQCLRLNRSPMGVARNMAGTTR